MPVVVQVAYHHHLARERGDYAATEDEPLLAEGLHRAHLAAVLGLPMWSKSDVD